VNLSFIISFCLVSNQEKKEQHMGGGRWDSTTYHSTRTDRASKGVADFAYTSVADKTQKVHENLDPKRISKKPFQKLESRDSVEHPESNAVLVCFDVTGSNKTRAIDAQAKLPALMEMLNKYLSDPQVAIACNDDYLVTGTNSVQISDFESDIRIDEHIRNAWLVGNGGGQQHGVVRPVAIRRGAQDDHRLLRSPRQEGLPLHVCR
jgi:hypothetical protein